MKKSLSILVLGCCFTACLHPQTVQHQVQATHGMVVSAHALASEVGVEVMKKGGNAVDAAVATGLALAVVHPGAGNIGGGGFMVIVMKDGRSTSIDFREKAPKTAHERMYLDANGRYIVDSNHEGYRSIGVPGTVAGFDLALRKFGTRSWKELAEPAIGLAEKGFKLSRAMGEDFRRLTKSMKNYASSRRVFLKNDTLPYGEGDVWRQSELAQSLRRIQKDGRDGFYRGMTAHLIALDMKRNGGLITEEDLEAYRAVERPVVRGTYRGYEILSMPPPSSGGVALVEMLNILEGFDLNSLPHNSPAYLHLLAETMRIAYRDRAKYLGDPDFVSTMPLTKLTSKKYAEEMRRSLDAYRASKSSLKGFVGMDESTETTHYSVIDGEGNAVVVTYTLEQGFGSHIVAEGTGILLNNEMGDFNPIPGLTDTTGYIGTKPNLVEPEKRILSSMTPTIILKDGRVWALVGSIGGRTIINTVLQVVLNLVDYRMSLAKAVEAGRIHHQWFPDHILVEQTLLTPELRKALEVMGHRVQHWSFPGRLNCIVVDPRTGMREGVADLRDPDAVAAGY